MVPATVVNLTCYIRFEKKKTIKMIKNILTE